LPFSDEQRRRLVRAAIDAHAWFDSPLFLGVEPGNAVQQELLAKMEQRDAKILAAARAVLSGEQLSNIENFREGKRKANEGTMNQAHR
jgi:hypothetical protein